MRERATGSRVSVRRSPSAAAALLLSAAMVDAASAVEAQPFEPEQKPAIRLKLDGSDATTLDLKRFTTFYADHVRARDRNPELMPPGNAARAGERGFSPGGVNVDDGTLNYAKGSSVSRSVNALADIELNHRPLGVRAFVRAKAWDDIAQRKNEVPHGNHPNGYAALRPLSDRGFSEHGEFNNATIMDAYVERTWAGVAGQPLLVRLGQQMIPWGQQETTILGGLEQINAIDYPARFRAASLLDGTLARDTGYVPAPAIFTRWGDRTSTTVVEAFYFFKFQQNELAGCGTFFALADYVTDGCDGVLAQPNTVTDPAAIAAGIYGDRAPDRDPKDAGQFGFALKQTTDFGQFGAYFANYHSRRFSPSAIRSTRAAALPPLIPGNPGNGNVRYFVEFPENVRVFGLTYAAADVKAGRWGLYGEYTYRPNQSVLLNSVDLFNAFASNVAPTQLRADATATPVGGRYPGYDRREISQLLIAGRTKIDKLLGGDLTLRGELGAKYIHDLPDVNVRRYGRSDLYGLGPVAGVCIPGSTAKQCSNEGYVTAFSWGYRARASMRYTGLVDGLAIVPSLGFQHDVKGYAHDIVFIEGRKGGTASLRAELSKFFVEAGWTAIWGGEYNFTKDRDFYTLAAGLQF